jgi:hypothetical protein
MILRQRRDSGAACILAECQDPTMRLKGYCHSRAEVYVSLYLMANVRILWRPDDAAKRAPKPE